MNGISVTFLLNFVIIFNSWFKNNPAKWNEFQKKYLKELNDNKEVIKLLRSLLGAISLIHRLISIFFFGDSFGQLKSTEKSSLLKMINCI